MTNPFTLSYLLDRGGISLDVSGTYIPHLIFDYVITTHQFFPSEYSKPIPKDRQKLHNEIQKLHELGWGYTKIHRHLRENGFKIGKSRTTVDSILKKMKKETGMDDQTIIINWAQAAVDKNPDGFEDGHYTIGNNVITVKDDIVVDVE